VHGWSELAHAVRIRPPPLPPAHHIRALVPPLSGRELERPRCRWFVESRCRRGAPHLASAWIQRAAARASSSSSQSPHPIAKPLSSR
jgi:hypothetical protein